jgi:hypothetical protein
LIVIGLLAAAVLPVGAVPPTQSAGGPRTITGTYQTTNPIYPILGAETGVLLYDLTGEVAHDFDFQVPLDAQVLGTLNGDIVSGDYVLELPDSPRGTVHDFDGDASTPPAVQVYVTATYINYLGDIYINRGESALDLSVRLEPMTYEVIAVTWWSVGHRGRAVPRQFWT